MGKLGEDKRISALDIADGPASTGLAITSNKTLGLGRKRTFIHGRPAAGKTFTGLSMDEAWPETMPAKKWVKLEGTLWVGIDQNATVGCLEKRIEVPVIDMSAEIARCDPENPANTSNILDVIERLVDALHNHVAKNKISHVGIDTVSKLDRAICRYWEANGPLTKAGHRDSFAIWRSIINTHDRFHQAMNALPCDVTFLFHSKPQSESDQMVAKTLASGLASGGDIVFDVAYNDVRNIYRRDLDLGLVVIREDEGGYARRHVYVSPKQGFEAKCRYEDSLPANEAFEPNLRALYARVEANIEAKK